MPRHELEYPNIPPTVAGRYASRGTHSLKTIHRIINSAPLLHVSYQAAGTPYNTIIPMIGRLGSFERPSADESEVLDLYLHVHANHKLANSTRKTKMDGNSIFYGVPLSVAATHADGLVLSLTPFSHSVNFRSAVVFGMATVVEDEDEKLWALKLITNGVVPMRWENTRNPPTQAELVSTAVLKVKITGGSAKIRDGGPGEEKANFSNSNVVSSVWTGVIPMYTTMSEPISGTECGVDDVPEYIKMWREETNEDRKAVSLEAANTK